MKAIVLNGFGDVSNFSFDEVDRPSFQEDQLLIRIKSAAFNPIDYQMRLGWRESRLMTSPILGREFSGVVEAVGKGVTGFSVGDEVIAASGSRGSNGTYAEYIAVTSKVVAHKPASLSFEAAAAIPSSGLTAFQAFRRMGMKALDSVFIAGGSGAVGRFLIKLLFADGVRKVVSTAGSEQSAGVLRAMGLEASCILDYRSEGLAEQLLAVNKGEFDFVVDLAGGQITETAAEVLKTNGTYVDITFLGTQRSREILFDRGDMILNISNYAYMLKNELGGYGEALQEISDRISSGGIAAPEVHVVGELGLGTVQEAHRLMESGALNGKKLVMRM
jgi:NADPH:quinone reductase-like Zn-dependent oxidoreductase